MRIILPSNYGEKELVIPDGIDVEVLTPQTVSIPSRREVVSNAFSSPVGTLPLEQLVGQNRKSKQGKVCIICEDKTRHSPAEVIMPIILDKLNAGGIPDEDIFVIMALGEHGAMSGEEIRKKIGDKVCSRVAVYNSECHDKSNLVDLGSPGGYPILLDRRVAEADIKIGVGSVIPHQIAGWGGGAKILLPGVTGMETVMGFHLSSHEFTENMYGQGMTSSRKFIEQQVGEIGLDFIVNSVSTPERDVYAVFCGDFIQAHRAAVERAKEVYFTPAKRKAHLIISNSFPLDVNFWMAGKALHSGDIVAEDGAEIVMISSCPDKLGPHPLFSELTEQAIQDRDQLLRDTKSGKVADIEASAMALMRTRTLMSRNKFGLVSDHLDPRTMERMGFTVYESIEHMIEGKLEEHGKNIKISVLTHGGSTIPVLT